jgi:arylsulfatase
MKSTAACLSLLSLWASSVGIGFVGAAQRPNVLVILADDLGFSDLGCYGSEIDTPNLDRLAAGGLKFTQFYNTARCWPTRAALLTGYYAQQVRRDTLPGMPWPSGGRGVRPPWARLLPDMLSPLGYRAYHSGKWHLDGKPIQCGFNRSYRMADHGRYFNPQRHFLDDRPLPPVKPGTDYYTTTAIADHAIEMLREHAAKYSDRPFFEYLAFTAPHFPLHALPEDIARYQGKYECGWDIIRGQRWQRIQQLGLVEGKLSEVEQEVGPPYDFPDALKTLGPGEVNRPLPWNELTPEQQAFQATKMTIHAAMIDRMDREIGRVLQQLKSMGAMENTLIFFLSDNGASAEIMVRDDGHDPRAPPGSAATYLCLGPGWSTSSNTPYRRHKTWTHEGGIHTPLIVRWPDRFSGRGQLCHGTGHVIDLAPTILAAAGGQWFKTWQDQPVPPAPGKSLLPILTANETIGRENLWWSHEGNRALRTGDWKLVAAGSEGPLELYDLATDPSESRNLADRHPEKVRVLQQAWAKLQDEFRQTATADLESKSAP